MVEWGVLKWTPFGPLLRDPFWGYMGYMSIWSRYEEVWAHGHMGSKGPIATGT